MLLTMPAPRRRRESPDHEMERSEPRLRVYQIERGGRICCEWIAVASISWPRPAPRSAPAVRWRAIARTRPLADLDLDRRPRDDISSSSTSDCDSNFRRRQGDWIRKLRLRFGEERRRSECRIGRYYLSGAAGAAGPHALARRSLEGFWLPLAAEQPVDERDQAVLHLDRAAHRVDHAAELDDAAVAGALDDAPVVGGDGRIDEIAAEALPSPLAAATARAV